MGRRLLFAGVASAGAVLLCCASFSVKDVAPAPDGEAVDGSAPDGGPAADAAAPTRIYLVGGQSSTGSSADLLAATVLDGGALGAWETAGTLPDEITGMAAGAGGDALILAGGRWSDTSSNAPTSLAFRREDGMLLAFAATHPLSNRFLPAGVVVAGRFYVTGGFGSLAGGEVVSTELTTQPVWRTEAPMPATRYDHGVAASGDLLFAAGGRAPTDDAGGNEEAIATVVVTKVLGDGTLMPWTPVASLPYAVYAHRLVTHQSSLYLVGGQNGFVPELGTKGLVRSAPIGSDGALGAWGVVTDIPGGSRAAHAAVVVGDYLFIVGGIVTRDSGGSPETAVSATVWSAHFNGRGGVDAWIPTTALPEPRAYGAAVAF